MAKKKLVIAVSGAFDLTRVEWAIDQFFRQDAYVYMLDVKREIQVPDADLIVTTCQESHAYVMDRAKDTKVLKALYGCRKESAVKLKGIRPDQKVLAFCHDDDTSRQVAHYLTSHSDRLIRPHEKDASGYDGESSLVLLGAESFGFDSRENLIRLGEVLLSPDTIIKIAMDLDLHFTIEKHGFSDYRKEVLPYEPYILSIYDYAKTLNVRVSSATYWTRRCYVEIDTDYTIQTINNVSEKLLNASREVVVGTKLAQWLPQITLDRVLESGIQIKDELIIIGDEDYAMSAYPIKDESDRVLGGFVIIEGIEHAQDHYRRVRGGLLKRGHIAHYSIHQIVGDSLHIKKLKAIIPKMAISDSSVLITGETGTGKEVIAQAIHNLSSRKDNPFVAINCSALTESLLESELFGYEDGAFTGAKKGGKRGVFEFANTGTVFLDEIGNMPLNLQSKLLRVIQEREIMPVGGTKIYKIDIRIIAATNKNINRLIESGDFMRDLYYRINVLPIHVMPLRDRSEDIRPLAEYFIKLNRYSFTVSDEAYRLLERYKWEGNVRELENCLQYFAHLFKSEITADDMPPNIEQVLGGVGAAIPRAVVLAPNNTLSETQKMMLHVLYESYQQSKRLGRKSIASRCTNYGARVTEQQARRLLKELHAKGLVEIKTGGGGSMLTQRGIELALELSDGRL